MGRLSRGVSSLRRAPLLAVAAVALTGGLLQASAPAATPAPAKCCAVKYNAANTHVQVTGVVAFQGTPIHFSFHGPCASPAGPGRAYVKSRWIPLRDLAAGYHTISIVQRVNGKIVYSKSPRFFVKGRLQERKPAVSITAGPSGVVEGTSAEFAFKATNPGQVLCRLDNRAWAACKGSVRYVDLPSGPHTFTVRVVALTGKTHVEATRFFVLSAPPPVEP